MKHKPKKRPAPAPEPKSSEKLTSPAADEVEPTAEKRVAPLWLVFAFGALIFGGEVYLDRHSGDFDKQVYEEFATVREMKAATPVMGVAGRIENGKALYAVSCAACHQANGQGLPSQFPPLAHSDWVLVNNPARMIRIALYGFGGPVTVNGQPYNGTMTPMSKDNGGPWTDEQLADILTFVRQEWGNGKPPVSPEEVKAIHQKVGPRGAWTADELLRIPVE